VQLIKELIINYVVVEMMKIIEIARNMYPYIQNNNVINDYAEETIEMRIFFLMIDEKKSLNES